MSGPFDLADTAAYSAWREEKFDSAPRRLEDILVALDDPRRLTDSERAALRAQCVRANMAVYTSRTRGQADKDIPRRLGAQIGLTHLDGNFLADDDGITPLAVAKSDADPRASKRGEFIPYTDKPIRWHTDGYYNPPERSVRGLLLHCVERAESGGENQLLDHELAYLLLRDENPDYIRALMAADVMSIPPRLAADGVARAEQAGPVFSLDDAGHLHMRYTARTRSITWKTDAATQAALVALERLLATPTPWTLRGRLEPGMGLVCNNVLHDRSGFVDSPAHRRLIYRARYYQRVA